jgi:carbon monoxide dehydrogenase subunit G
MKFATSSILSAPPQAVFQALLDAEVLRRSIPGCEMLTPDGTGGYDARVKVGVGAIKGTYSGRAEIRDSKYAESLTLVFNGKGAPGFVSGTAAIRIAPHDGDTRLSIDTDVQVGGAIAAVGSRLIETIARRLTGEFFSRLCQELPH